MGTLVRITLYAPDESSARSAFAAAYARIADLDRTLSDYNPQSELNRLCREAWRRPVAVSADLYTVLEASQKLAAETGGAFDITLGPVILLSRQARQDGRMPAQQALERARMLSGYQKLRLDPERHAVTLAAEGMHLDVGGIAKGYAADEALAVLRSLGIPRALVAVSGDLAIGDAPPGTAGWRVGIGSGPAQPGGFARILVIENTAVSTSGDSQQFVEIGGVRYSHIVDPRTGIGLRQSIAVTVIARRGITADGLSTAVSVLGPDRGLQYLEEATDAAALITISTDSGTRVVASPRFERRFGRAATR